MKVDTKVEVGRVYDFGKKLATSKEVPVEAAIREMIDGCIAVVASSESEDRAGVDYWAALRGGRQIGIDVKIRERGCSEFWFGGPEVALEKWSVVPTEQSKGVVGWTLDERKVTEMVFFGFHPADSRDAALVCFQQLRIAFRRNVNHWFATYPHARQNSGDWQSECVFVPLAVVLLAIQNLSRQQVAS